MTAPYSLYQRVQDGQLTGPRFLLHAIKFAQHAAPAFALLCAFRLDHALAITAACGPIAYALVILRKLWIARRERYPLELFVVTHFADWCFDASFAYATLALGLLAAGYWLAGGLLLMACVADYVALHRRGVP